MNLILAYPYNLSSDNTYNAMIGRAEPAMYINFYSVYGLNVKNIVSIWILKYE